MNLLYYLLQYELLEADEVESIDQALKSILKKGSKISKYNIDDAAPEIKDFNKKNSLEKTETISESRTNQK